MKTPILDFVKNYISQNNLRLHMPGHKGSGLLGFEQFDITEIVGADSLYEANGIIAKSEENASKLFGCNTLYSTEGSSHCIRAMLYLAVQGAKGRPLIAAGRNAHKAFWSAAAMLDFDIDWLSGNEGYLSFNITADSLENYFKTTKPTALYLTSPDYLGNMLDIRKISEVCHKYGVLLLIDNAHGAYLKFLPEDAHPIDLGADMCADSAHKTLPALTGAAYLHISKNAPYHLLKGAKNALAMFGSTSPSYLILQSLDAVNAYLTTYPKKLKAFIKKVDALKLKLKNKGFTLVGSEPLKITIAPKAFGYLGETLADILLNQNIVVEFFDPDYVTLMLTPETGHDGLKRLGRALLSLPALTPITAAPPTLTLPKKALTPREAAFKCSETLPANDCLGKILAVSTVGCPPAVPIIASGEVIDESIIAAAKYYKIKSFTVIK